MEANNAQLDRLVGLSMLIAATSIFVYYTVWTLFMVRLHHLACAFFEGLYGSFCGRLLTYVAIRRR
jgi:hypothetical protein